MASAAETGPGLVKLISAEGHEFWVDRKCACISGTIKAMLSGASGNWRRGGGVLVGLHARMRRARARPRAPRPIRRVLRRDQVPGYSHGHPGEGDPVFLLQGAVHQLERSHSRVPHRARDRARAAHGGQLPRVRSPRARALSSLFSSFARSRFVSLFPSASTKSPPGPRRSPLTSA